MTVVHNNPLLNMRGILGKAKRSEDGRISDRRNGVKRSIFIHKTKRNPARKTVEAQARYDEVVAESKRLGLEIAPRDPKFRGLDKKSKKKVHLALTETQIKEKNKELIVKNLIILKQKAATLYGKRHRVLLRKDI